MTEPLLLGKRLQRVHALREPPDLTGRVVLVTGGTDGVGRALAEQLARAGATTVLTARDAAKGERVRSEIVSTTGNTAVAVVALDLSSLDSVRSAAADVLQRWARLDLLICNAGVMAEGNRREVTTDGHERLFGVNHLAHALLIDRLEQRLRDSSPSRVVVVASEAHRRAKDGLDFDDLMMTGPDYRGGLAYGRSKLANILYTKELARRWVGSGVTVNAVHPGSVDTPMMRSQLRGPVLGLLHALLRRTLLITASDAAAGVLRVALDPELASTTGAYFEVGTLTRPKPMAEDDEAARQLFEVTRTLIGAVPGDGTGQAK